MSEIPLCKPYFSEEIVGSVNFTDKDYEAYFVQSLMYDLKFNIGAEIRHGGDEPKLVLLCFAPVPARRDTRVSALCDTREYGQNGVRRCRFLENHFGDHNFGPWE